VKEDFEKLVSSVIELGNRLTQAAENAIEIGKKRVA
jgi:hypothetical protein